MAESKRSRWGWQAIVAALAIAALVLALAGIRGEIASAGGAAEASRASTVAIDGFAYRPATLTVGRGSQVVFSNKDGVTHTATRNGGFTTGRIKPGKAASIRFGQRGTFRYHCSIHPSMRGKVIVD